MRFVRLKGRSFGDPETARPVYVDADRVIAITEHVHKTYPTGDYRPEAAVNVVYSIVYLDGESASTDSEAGFNVEGTALSVLDALGLPTITQT